MKIGLICREINPYQPQKKEIAPLIIAGIAAAGSLAAAGIGAAASAKASRDARKREDQWYAREYARGLRKANESILDKASGQNLMRMAKDHARQQWRKAAGAQAVAGGTAAASQMAKDAGNKMVADTAANLAAMDTARQERAEDRLSSLNNQHMKNQQAIDDQRSQQATMAAAQASNAIMQGVSAYAGQPNLKGATNNSTTTTPSISNNTAQALNTNGLTQTELDRLAKANNTSNISSSTTNVNGLTEAQMEAYRRMIATNVGG